MLRLEGRVVIVTGGGSGIGRGAALRIAEEGGHVVLADKRLPLAEDVVREIRLSGGEAIAVECDVTDENQVMAMVDQTIDSFGSVWGMVANAGTSGSGWIHQTDRADWQFVLDVNLTGPFLCAKHTLPLMMETGGSFVVTSSIAGSVVGAGGAAASYAVSKLSLIHI